jgi:hypothetical protein
MIRNVRNYGMSNYHSSSTLQNSVNTCSFGKTLRFKDSYKKPIVETFYDLPGLKLTRSTTFGIGDRKVFKNLNNSPSPDRYNIKGSVDISLEKRKGTKLMPRIEPLVKRYNS